MIETGVLHAASWHDARAIALTIDLLGSRVMSAPGALVRVLRVGLRITTLITNKTTHLTIYGKVAVPMKYTR